jgi:DNA-binding protein HU-beta
MSAAGAVFHTVPRLFFALAHVFFLARVAGPCYPGTVNSVSRPWSFSERRRGATMTKTELVNALAKNSQLEKKQAKVFLEALTGVVGKQIKKGEEVPLTGLGKFKVSRRKARMGRNPQTGEAIKIPAKKVVKFSVARPLKDLIGPSPKKKAKKKTYRKR